jgi:GT2 family glycosyltransferase
MDISIITSLYKSERFLSRFISRIGSFNKSILKYNIETEYIIIANNTSNEEEIILARCRLPNLKIIRIPRETLYASWNRGIREASSEIIAFWNVDDIRLPGALYLGVDEIRKGAELVYFSFIIFGITRISLFNKRIKFPFLVFKRVKSIPYSRDLFIRGCLCGPFFIFNRNIIGKIGFFDESFTIAGDYEWFARASCNNIKFKNIDQTGGIFIVHSNNISGINHQIHVNENESVINKYLNK